MNKTTIDGPPPKVHRETYLIGKISFDARCSNANVLSPLIMALEPKSYKKNWLNSGIRMQASTKNYYTLKCFITRYGGEKYG